MPDLNTNVTVADDEDALLAPPEPVQLKVTPAPKEVATIENNQVQTDGVDAKLNKLVNLSPNELLDLNQKADAFSMQIAGLNPASPDFEKSINAIGRIGQDAFNSTTDVTAKFMTSSVKADRDAGGAKAQVSSELLRLRKITDQIAPKANTFNTGFLSKIPGFNRVHDYFKQYESADKQLQAILTNLDAGKDGLQRDNSVIASQQTTLWADLQTLKKADVLLARIDDNVVKRIQDAKDTGDMDTAGELEKDVLFRVRQRRMDVKTQAAVTIQAYMSMNVIKNNNKELMKGIERSKTTTMVALRVAVIVAQALDDQKLVLDTLDAVDKTTNALIDNNSKMLEANTLRIQQRAVQSGVRPETLERAFDSLRKTMDSIDAFHLEANKSFDETINRLDEQQKKIEPYLERAHKQAESDKDDDYLLNS